MAARKLPKTLTADDAAALLEVPNPRAPTGVRNRAMIELMYRSGLRVSEACGVHLRDWRPKEGTIRVRTEVAKGGRDAVAYVDRRSEPYLEQWIAIRRGF